MKFYSLIILVLLETVLSGCSPKVDDSVKEFVKKTKDQKSKYVSKVPDIGKKVVFQYNAFEFRDPFLPYSLPTAEAGSAPSQGGGPDLNRPREALEAFPIDSIHMVGTIERDGIFYALLKSASGGIYRVSVGNYIGQNSGKIEKINSSEIAVKEWLSNGKGGWREHLLTIPLLNTSGKKKGA